MILLTGFDSDYTLGNDFERSLKEHCNIPFRVFAVGGTVAGRISVPVPDMPHRMMQEGGFIQHIPDIQDDEVVIFTDADLVMQRHFTEEELQWLEDFGDGEIGCGVNQYEGATLEMEYNQLRAIASKDEVERVFPGFRDKPIWNTGFVVARKSTYAQLRDEFYKVREDLDKLFLWHPRVQFALSYIMGTKLSHKVVPQTMHTHGHCGWPVGVTKDDDGTIRKDGTVVCFRHKI